MVNPQAWLAGLMDGEGSFGWISNKKVLKNGTEKTSRSPVIQLNMCDEDVVLHAASMMGIDKCHRCPASSKNPKHRDSFYVKKHGKSALEVMINLYPWLHSYQRSRIAAVIGSPLPTVSFTHNDEWLAGLLEGEGCFGIADSGFQHYYPFVRVGMTAIDVVQTAIDLMGGSCIQTREYEDSNWNTLYVATVTCTKALDVMKRIIPFMGERRSEKIRSILDKFVNWQPRTNLTQDDIISIYSRAWAGEKQNIIAKEFGIAQGAVSKIKLGKRRADITSKIAIL